MQKVAAVGSRDTVLAFKALGITAVFADTQEEISQAIYRLASEKYAVIFITEAAAEKAQETISRYKTEALPAIIPIPGATGATGVGMRNVRANVEKAVGADILFKEEG